MDALSELSGPLRAPLASTILDTIAAGAADADATRTIRPEVIDAVRSSGLLRLTAADAVGSGAQPIRVVGGELEAVASACASTAWVLWNHLAVFHLFCGTLGPDHTPLLRGIVERQERVCFPAGAASRVHGRLEAGQPDATECVLVDGPGSFGSGCRYADWAGVAFAMVDTETRSPLQPLDLRFSIVRLTDPGVAIDPTWDGAGLRATATDTVRYESVAVPTGRLAPWYSANRAERLRATDVEVIDGRYREDWVGLSALWLAAMATGVVGAALADVVAEVGGRRAILGRSMTDLDGVRVRIGRAALALTSARSLWLQGCADVDARIDAGTAPIEADELRQLAVAVSTLGLCRDAMDDLRLVLGGNGLRESHPFDRRWRDFQAMPLHINGHEDRVIERVGRHVLGLEQTIF